MSIDTHAHLTYPPLDSDLPGVLERAVNAGVEAIIIPGTSVEVSRESIRLAETYCSDRLSLYPAVGIHPGEAEDYVPEMRGELRSLLDSHTQIRAVGEVGLDNFYVRQAAEPRRLREQQRRLFSDMLSLALEKEKPLVLHCREAYEDIAGMVREAAPGHPAVIHCFTGTRDQAFSWLDQGGLLSFAGILTFKKNQELRDVAAQLPLERLMVDTDAPYLAPEGFRGTTCEPWHVSRVISCLAEIFSLEISEVEAITTQTAKRFFAIP
jgi:TatD DNase family protein